MLLPLVLALGATEALQPRAARRSTVRMVSNLLPNLPNPGAKKATAMPEIPEALKEPGLKVPATAWKWPRSWPYAADGMVPVGDVAKSDKVVFDEASLQELKMHLVRQMDSRAGSVLEISGSGGDSVLPEDGGMEEIWFPPASVTRLEGAVLETENTLPYADEAFDVIVMTSAAELLTAPRAAFREVWRCLKPGGRAIVAFSAARCSSAAHQASMTKTWRDYNDAQRIWVVGSYFHFSAGAPAQAMVSPETSTQADTTKTFRDVWGAGWRALRGYDYFSTADDSSNNNKVTPLYVVQADKAVAAPAGEERTPSAAADAAMWAAANMEEDDKRLCATRILSLVEVGEEGAAGGANKKTAAEARAAFAASNLASLYATLQPMSAVIATPLLSQLAANLAPRWDPASATQTAALRESLGMDTPRALFWQPLGDLTTKLSVDAKLWLLNDLLPFFADSENPPQAAALLSVKENNATVAEGALEAALRVVAAKTQSRAFDEAEVQLLACDVVARDFLPDAAACATLPEARKAAAAFAAWLETLEPEAFVTMLRDRQNFREIAEKEAEDAAMDPDQARIKAETLAKAAAVEAMLNDIAKRRNAAKEAAIAS